MPERWVLTVRLISCSTHPPPTASSIRSLALLNPLTGRRPKVLVNT
jgi:hypothetical protein